MNTQRHISKKVSHGYSLIELTISMGLSFFLCATAANFIVINTNFQKNINHRLAIQNFKSEILNNLFNGPNWAVTIANANNWNIGGGTNTGLECLHYNTDCSQSSGTFTIYSSATNQILYNSNDPTAGFDLNGQVCNGFSMTSPNPACPYRYNISWSPICQSTSICTNPQVIITGIFQSDPSFINSSSGPTNTSNFNFVYSPKPVKNILISSKFLPAPGSVLTNYSYVALEVDWKRKLAYLGSRQGSAVCLVVVDFGNERNPVILTTLGTSSVPSTLSGVCLGVRLYNDGTRLAVSSLNGGLDIFDLGADPRALNWTKLSSAPAGNSRQFEVVTTPTMTTFFFTLKFGFCIFTVPEPAGFPLTLVNSYSFPFGQLNASTTIGGRYFLAGDFFGNGVPIEQIIIPAGGGPMTLGTTYSMAPNNNYWSWVTTHSSDSKKAYVAGAGGAFFSTDPTNDTAVVTARHNQTSTAILRDAIFVDINGHNYLYSVTGGDRYLDVWNTDNIAAPFLVYSNQILEGSGETYGIRVDPKTGRAIVITNRSNFYVIDISQLSPASPSRISALSLY